MYTVHLWLELSESTDESDCGHLSDKASRLQKYIDDNITMIRSSGDCVHSVNYTKVLQFSAGSNHIGNNHDAILLLLKYLVEILPGSHGLVYWSDDERTDGNCYNVIVIARGVLYDRPDPFLSPKNPVIED